MAAYAREKTNGTRTCAPTRNLTQVRALADKRTPPTPFRGRPQNVSSGFTDQGVPEIAVVREPARCLFLVQCPSSCVETTRQDFRTNLGKSPSLENFAGFVDRKALRSSRSHGARIRRIRDLDRFRADKRRRSLLRSAIRKRALSENGDYRNLAIPRFATAAIRLIIKLASCPHYTEREAFHFDAHRLITSPALALYRARLVMTTIKKLGPADESVATGERK